MTEEEPPPPASSGRVPEFTLAITALGLLAGQEVYQGYFFCTGRKGPGPTDIQSAWLLLLITYITLSIGIAHGARWAWWSSIVLLSIFAYGHVRSSLGTIGRRLWPRDPVVGNGGGVIDFDRPPSLFDVTWLICRNGLLVSVPLFLLLGAYRIWLRRRKVP